MQKTNGNTRGEWIRRLFWPLLIVMLAAIAFGVYLRFFGEVRGVEFSPERFVHRNYHYYAIGGIRLGPRQTREWRSALEVYVDEQGLIKPADPVPVVWDMVQEQRGNGAWASGPAKQMCEELRCFSGASSEWTTWSAQHPELAAKLWPRVIALARDRDYEQIHNALLAARLAEKDGNFEKYYEEFVGARPLEP